MKDLGVELVIARLVLAEDAHDDIVLLGLAFLFDLDKQELALVLRVLSQLYR